MKPVKRKQAGSSAATPKVKQARMDQPPPLPTEVWELIFRNLNGYYLKMARQTCSSWNRIILGSTQLMGKFVLSLTSTHFAKHRKHVRALLATGGYTEAVFHMYGIGNHKPRINWLVPLGLTLHTLVFETSGTLLLLAQILKETPNLKRLDIGMDNRSTIDVVPDFRLEKLEELSIKCFTCPAKLMRFCRQICPRLTALKVFSSPLSEGYEPEIVAFVLEVRNTLQELETGLTLAIVSALETMADLRLTRANLSGSSEHCLRLIRSQPSLVQLDISRGVVDLAVENLDEILTLLPHLKTLAVKFQAYTSQPSLSCQTPSNIETLCINYGYPHRGSDFRLNLNIRNQPKLRHLSLSCCNVSRRNLKDANITSLTLNHCHLKRLTDLLLLTSLQQIELKSIRCGDITVPESDEPSRSTVRSLKVTRVNREVCMAAVQLFQGLEQFEAGDGVDIDEDVLEELSENSWQLKRLRLSGCSFETNCPSETLHLFGALETYFILCPVDVFEELEESLEGLCGGVEIRLQGKKDIREFDF